MCKQSKKILNRVIKLSTIKTDKQIISDTIDSLVLFAKNLKKKKRKINHSEEKFIIQKLIFLMKDINVNLDKQAFNLIIECINMIMTKQEVDHINLTNTLREFEDPELNIKGDEEEDEESVVKTLDIDKVVELENILKSRIFSQDIAVSTVTKKIKLNVSGFVEDNKPIGSFLFTGPTGVGKTEFVKELANNLGIDLIRFDMSEYNIAEFGLTRFVGSAPGYRNSENGGTLTNAVLEKPLSVLLFDEIEKASRELMPIFLQILDNAELTDGMGKKVCFKNTIIFMTSNLGAKAENTVGFANNKLTSNDNEIKEFFAPEFLNRLDAIVKFNPLEKNVSMRIVDKFLKDTENMLSKKNIKINVSDIAKEKLLDLGFDKDMGARAMNRVVTTEIKMPISEQILSKELKDGGSVNIDIKNDEFSFILK